jgi:hypothetical protein
MWKISGGLKDTAYPCPAFRGKALQCEKYRAVALSIPTGKHNDGFFTSFHFASLRSE